MLTGIAFGMAEILLKLFKINHPKNSFFVYFLVFLIAFSFIPLTIVGLSLSSNTNISDSESIQELTDSEQHLKNLSNTQISSKITPLCNNIRNSSSGAIPSRFILEISWYDFIVDEPNNNGLTEVDAEMNLKDSSEDNNLEKTSVTTALLNRINSLPPMLFGLIVLVVSAAFFSCYHLFYVKTRYLKKIGAWNEEDPSLIALVEQLSKQLQIKTPNIYRYHGAPNAFVFGYPAILVISDRLPLVLSDNELKTTLRHELTHIKHHDILLKVFIQTSRILCFFNPFVHLAAKKIFNKRELLADSSYNTSHDDKVSFMQALIKIAEYTKSIPSVKNISIPTVSMSLLQHTSFHPTMTERFLSLFKQCQKKTIITIFVSLIILCAQASAILFAQSQFTKSIESDSHSDDLIHVEKQYVVEDVTYTTFYQDNEQFKGKMVHKTLYNVVSLPPFANNSNLAEIINYILLKYHQNQQSVSAF